MPECHIAKRRTGIPGQAVTSRARHRSECDLVKFCTNSAGHDGTVRVWDIRLKKELRRFEGHAGNVLCVCFTPDNATVLSGGEDGTVRVWPLSE